MTAVEEWHPRLDLAAELLIPTWLAVSTWFPLVLVVGIVRRPGSGGPSVVALLGVVVLLWPLVVFKPWREGVNERVREWADDYRHGLAVTAALSLLAVLASWGGVAGGLVGLLFLPTRGSAAVTYGASLYYRSVAGPAVGDAVFAVGQWYFRVLWLYVASAVLTAPLRWGADG